MPSALRAPAPVNLGVMRRGESGDMKTLIDLTPTDFENLTFDLVQAMGLRNCVWRTPGRDGGRDIEGEWMVEDISGFTRSERWYVECKRYQDSVSWPTVWEKIAFAEANSAEILLVVTTSSLSPQAVDEVNKWNKLSKRPLIRFWGGHDIAPRIQLQPAILVKYGLSENPAADAAIAILPLTRMLLRYAHSAESEEEFTEGKSRTMSAVYALAELISARLESIQANSGFYPLQFRNAIDGYSWLNNSHLIESCGIDRLAARAAMSMIWAYTNSPIDMELRENKIFAKIGKPLPEALVSELQVIGQWGYLVFHQDIPATEVSIEKQ